MNWIIILFLCSLAVNLVQIAISKYKKSIEKDFKESYNRITQNNRKLQEAILKINKIEEERQKDVSEIKSAPDNRVTDILNTVMRNASSKRKS